MDNLNLTWIECSATWDGPLEVRVRGDSMKPTLKPGECVHIEPVRVQDLRPGDIVLMRHGHGGGVLHRYLGTTPQGALLTRGDNRRWPDAPWPPEALVGRATAWTRADGTIAHPDAFAQRINARYRLLAARVWRALYHLRALLSFLLALFLVGGVGAAVTITKFTATYESGKVHLYWETASEVDLIGFYVSRAVDTPTQYTRITEDIIPAEGSLVGAPYSFDDTAIQPGRTYYYMLEAEDTTGSIETHGPVTITIPGPTLTPTPGPSPTPTRTPTPGPSPTPTRTSTPGPSPTPTRTRTPAPAVTPTRTPTPLPVSTPMRTVTPLPGVTPSPTVTQGATTLPPSAEMTPAPGVTASPTSTPSATLPGAPTEAPTPTRIPVTPTPTPAAAPTGLLVVMLLAGVLGGLAFWWRRRR